MRRPIVSAALLLAAWAVATDSGCSREPAPYIAPADTVSPGMMAEDLDFVVEKLRSVHPSTAGGFSESREALISAIRGRIGEPMTKEQFFFALNPLFHSFHDAHTTQWLDFSRGIDLPLVWLQDGLYVERETGAFAAGDLLLRIGGRDVPSLREMLGGILWAENGHLVRLEGTWMLIARPYLEHLGLIGGDSVAVACLSGGRERAVRLPIVDLERPDRGVKEAVTCSVDAYPDLAVLRLDECRFDREYHEKLGRFFGEVRERGIGNVAVDLRRNSGGDSRVIDEFLAYIDVDSIYTYGSLVRHSHDARVQTRTPGWGIEEFPRGRRPNARTSGESLLYAGRLFVLTSPNTFSSANMFAAVLQDNGLATVVGEPTGNSPSCFGHPLTFRTPRTGIPFRVSHKRFFRPDPSKDDLDAVYPDIESYRTIGDVINGEDPQIRLLIDLIRGEREEPEGAE